MKPREREALFRQMRRHGVSRYAAEGVDVTLGDIAPSPAVVTAAPDDSALELPDGVIDPRRKLAEIYAKAQGRRQ